MKMMEKWTLLIFLMKTGVAETTSQLEIESDESLEYLFCGCKVLVQDKPPQLLQEEAGPELEEVYIEEVQVKEHMVVCMLHLNNQLNKIVMMEKIKHPQL